MTVTIDDCKKLRPDFVLEEGRWVYGTHRARWTHRGAPYELYGGEPQHLLDVCHRQMVVRDEMEGARR